MRPILEVSTDGKKAYVSDEADIERNRKKWEADFPPGKHSEFVLTVDELIKYLTNEVPYHDGTRALIVFDWDELTGQWVHGTLHRYDKTLLVVTIGDMDYTITAIELTDDELAQLLPYHESPWYKI